MLQISYNKILMFIPCRDTNQLNAVFDLAKGGAADGGQTRRSQKGFCAAAAPVFETLVKFS